jgi:hypothetical protein
MKIFVSYTTRDYYIDRELLECVSKVLLEFGEYYIDMLHNDSSNKQSHVDIMLSQAKSLLLISSSSVNESEWVQWELQEAERYRIPIITVHATPNREETIKNLQLTLSSEFKKLTRSSNIVLAQNSALPLDCLRFTSAVV